MTEEDVELLTKFQSRTVLTIGTAQTVAFYRDRIVDIGCQHDFLIHITLTLVLMHDRHLATDSYSEPTTKETFHTYHGTAIFSEKLNHDMKNEEKDAMWGAAALLGAITFASFDGKSADESWPLKEASASDLDWLRMSDGKKGTTLMAKSRCGL